MNRSLVSLLAAAVLAILLLAFAPVLWQMWHGSAEAGRADQDLPWQIETPGPGRSRVFGLEPGQSRLADAQARWGDGIRLALLARDGEAGQLEAYVEQAQLGFIGGRLVLTAALPEALARRFQQGASKVEPLASGARRYQLAATDEGEAWAQTLQSLSLLPSARLDEATLRERFGAPQERLVLADQAHLLYPARGLDLTVAADGKPARVLMQYVAPRDFQRLRAPLANASAQNGAGQ